MLRVGVNYPWLRYDWDFGEPPRDASGRPWGPRAEWRNRIEHDLEHFREIGVFAVRWWILGSGLLYGTGADPPPLAAAVVDDFASALPYFRQARIQLLPVFVDFTMFLEPKTAAVAAPGYVKGGRAALVANAATRALFLERALQPLLDAARPYADVIYGWDLINEPEWCVRDPGPGVPRGTRPTLRRSDMLSFLREGIDRINRAGFRSSSGFAHYQTLIAWRSIELGVRLHQFHYYGGPGVVPAHTFHPDYPIIVGELATAPHRPWPELRSEDALFNRLRHLEEKGFPSAFLWAAQDASAVTPDGEAPAAAWNEIVWEQIRRFTLTSAAPRRASGSSASCL
jgi:hypothetical protein